MPEAAPRGGPSLRRATAWRLLAALVLAVLAVPSLYVHAHLRFVPHHAHEHDAHDQRSSEHDAGTRRADPHEHGPDHAPDDHARDLHLKYTHRRAGGVAPTVTALPATGGTPLRTPVLLAPLDATAPAAQGRGPAAAQRARGPPAAA